MRTLALLGVVAVAGATPAAVRPTASLSIPRAAHTATLLADGNVLVAGGCTAAGCELEGDGRTTEVYDLDRRSFVPGPPLSRPRVGHAAVRLRDGRVLVAGGWDRNGLARDAELFDPARGGAFLPAGSLGTGRGGFTATLLADGRVLFAGGEANGTTLASAELYDLHTGTFEPTRPMRQARAAHAAARLRDGRVLVVGGSATGRVLRSAELFDPRSGRWSPAGSLAMARHKHGAVVLRDGSVLVVGGSDARDWRGRFASAELWSRRTRRFTPAGRMAARRFKLSDAVVRLPSGRVLIAGGARTAETYDARRRRFSAAGRLGTELFFATATLLPTGVVLVVGGYDADIAVSRRAWLLG